MNTKKAVKIDLEDACDAIEHLVTLIPKMTLAQKVDVTARLRGAGKSIESIDKTVKDEIKAHLGNQAGTVSGDIFKAVLAYNDVKRLDQAALKEEKPKIFADYCKEKPEGRVTFEPR